MFYYILTFLWLLFFPAFLLFIFASIYRPRNMNHGGLPLRVGRGRPVGMSQRPTRPPRDEKSPDHPDQPLSHDGGLDSCETVIEIKEILLRRKFKLPPELVDMIMDYAEHWACTSSSADYSKLNPVDFIVRGTGTGENQMLFRTKPIALPHWSAQDPRLWQEEAYPATIADSAEYSKEDLDRLAGGLGTTLEHPVRKIVFDITSKDQGSGGEGPRGQYHHSWTWFDAGLEKFDKTVHCPVDCPERTDTSSDTENIPTCAIRPVWPATTAATENQKPKFRHELLGEPKHLIQRNKLATSQYSDHHVEWSWKDSIDPESAAASDLEAQGRGKGTGNGEFVRGLRAGDMVAIWARARFPGWRNYVKKVEVKVYWAV